MACLRSGRYDIAFSVYHALDAASLANLTRNATLKRVLMERATRITTAIDRDLFVPDVVDVDVVTATTATVGQQTDPGDVPGTYVNRLYNGTFYHRLSPTSLSPMLLEPLRSAMAKNSTSSLGNARLQSMLSLLQDPAKFCVNAEHLAERGSMLWRMTATGAIAPKGDSVTCASDACLASTVLAVADFEGVEAVVAQAQSPESDAALVRYQNPDTGRTVLTVDGLFKPPAG